MSIFYLPNNASKARLREAETARQKRAEIMKAYSQGKVPRRDLVKWGLFTTAGVMAPISGLSPFVAYADGGSGGTSSNIPTGMPASPLFGVQAFTTAMPRFDVIYRRNSADTGDDYFHRRRQGNLRSYPDKTVDKGAAACPPQQTNIGSARAPRFGSRLISHLDRRTSHDRLSR